MFENIINSHDSEILKNITNSICGIVENFIGHPKKVQELITPTLSKKLLSFLNPNLTTGANVTPRIIKTLGIIIKLSPEHAHLALKEKIADNLYQVLTKHASTFDDGDGDTTMLEKDNTSIVHALIYAPKEIMSSSLSIFSYVLPDVSVDEGCEFTGPFKLKYTTEAQKKKAEKRLALLNSDPLVLIHFANVTISLLIDIYSSSVDLTVRRSVLGTILKILDALTPESLKSVVENIEISLLLSSIFSRRDNPSLVVGALEIGHLLLQKLPELYAPAFFRGGIIHDVKSILSDEEDKIKATSDSTVRAEPENDNEQENDEDEEDEEEDEGEDSEEDHDDYGEDSRQSDGENESSLSHLTKFYFFDSNLSPVIIYDAKTFIACYERNLQTSEFEAMQKEREELEVLSEKIRCDKANIKEHYAAFAEKLNKVSEFELLSSHILESVLESLTSDASSDMKKITLDFLSTFYKNGSPRTFELLIERLTELLARFEKFDVISADISGSQSSPASLARQLRINLVPEDNKKKAKPITISIQAIATFNTVEEFFKQKLDLDIFNTGSKFFDRLSSSLYESEEEEEEQEEELQEGEPKEDTEDSSNVDPNSEWHLEFYIDGELMPKDATIFGSIYRYLQAKEEAKLKPGETLSKNFALGIWSTPYQITFKKVNGPKPEVKETPIEAEAINPCFEVPSSFGDNESISVVVRLLSVLFNINSSIPELVGLDHTIRPLAISKFLSYKLSAKLNRQLEEPLVVVGGILPDWTVDATRLYPFLFPFETRYSFLQSTSFGYSRLIFKWLNNNNNSRREQNSSRSMGRLMRQKVRVSRNHLLQSAIKVLDLYGASPYVLEVEFFDDVGTGSGPTLEFYASVSKQFTRKKLSIWRNEDTDPKNQFVFNKQGLYPLPYSPEFFDTKAGAKVLGFFKSLGIFIARAMLDSRIIDINFNPVFFRNSFSSSVGGNSIGTVSLVDKQLGQSLSMLQKFVELKKQGVVNPEVDGAHIEDLALDFTYPGQSNLLLKENGANINVTLDNIESYIDSVVDMTIGFGVETQINAFREGFSQVFPYAALHAFNPEELVVMCGQGENDWSYELLCSAAKADHGYSLDSRIVRELFEVMSTFTKAEQKQFLQFVTGSPNLPIGGFKALSPPFTIVCRESEMPLTPDDYLPTVMTCVNYFKLPNYSSKEVLKERLKTAISEGSGSFLLS